MVEGNKNGENFLISPPVLSFLLLKPFNQALKSLLNPNSNQRNLQRNPWSFHIKFEEKETQQPKE